MGLLVGAASVAIGMGVMQIPEEQRNNVRNHAATSLERARDLAYDVGESMSTSCGKYSSTDPAEILGKVIPDEIMDHCGCFPFPSSTKDGEDRGERSHRKGGCDGVMGGVGDDVLSMEDEIRSEGSSPMANAVIGVERGMHRLVGDVFRDDQQHHTSPVSLSMNLVGGGGGINGVGDNKGRGVGGGGEGHGGLVALENEDIGRRVACGRKGENSHTLPSPMEFRACEVVVSSCGRTSISNFLLTPPPLLLEQNERPRCSAKSNSLASAIFAATGIFGRYGKRSHYPG